MVNLQGIATSFRNTLSSGLEHAAHALNSIPGSATAKTGVTRVWTWIRVNFDKVTAQISYYVGPYFRKGLNWVQRQKPVVLVVSGLTALAGCSLFSGAIFRRNAPGPAAPTGPTAPATPGSPAV